MTANKKAARGGLWNGARRPGYRGVEVGQVLTPMSV